MGGRPTGSQTACGGRAPLYHPAAVPFAHLHVHSEYSILDGVASPEALCRAAAERGNEALALTDHGAMHGVPAFARAARRAGIKPLVGVEAYIVDRFGFGEDDGRRAPTHHITLLAQDETGYRNLCRLTTKAHLEGFYRRPRMHLDWLAERAEGVIVLSGCLQGILAQALLRDDEKHAEERAGWFREVFGDRFFLEVMDHGLPAEAKVAKGLFAIADRTGIPVVATNDVHYVDEGGHEAQDLLLAIRQNVPLDDPDRMRASLATLFMRDEAEMKALFPERTEAVTGTQAVVEMASDLGGLFDREEPLFPAVEVPKGHDGPMSWLGSLARDGLAERYGDPPPAAATERLEREMAVIERLGYPDYFLAVRDFVAEAKGRGIPVGPGRGSAAGSIVSYALGITRVDPLAHGLLFERFLNEGRKSLPDIDIDFCTLRRDEVIDYIRERHGREKVAQIVTFNRLKGKLAFRDMARLSGIPEVRYGLVAKALTDGEALAAAAENAVAAGLLDKDADCREALSKARRVENTIRNKGVHAAGLVIAPVALADLVPLARDRSGAVVSQYEMGDLEAMGLVKMDVLGIRNLTLLDEAEREIRRQGGECDLDSLPDGDEEAFALLGRGDTAGVFQFEAQNAIRLLKAIKPTTVEELAVVNALNRPGPLNSGLADRYVRRRKGKEEPEPPHPALEEVFRDTLGVMVYQEQVMRMAQEIAGYSLVDADDLRKAMGKKIASLMAAQEQRFVDGCAKVGKVNAAEAKRLFDQTAEFAQYGFNKSHAVAYSVVGYQCAWLKAHHPAQFHAAWLSSFGGNAEAVGGYASQLVAQGVPIMPPSVNRSRAAFSVEEDQVRYGLASVRHVGTAAAEALVAEREAGGDFADLGDFALRAVGKMSRRAAESLAAAGAFDDMGLDRRALMVVMDEVFKEAEAHAGMAGQEMLFADAPRVRVREPAAAEVAAVPPREVLEFQALDAFLTTSPLGDREADFREMGLPTIAEARGAKGTLSLAGFLSGAKVLRGYGGRKRAEGWLQDGTDRVEWVMYEEALAVTPGEDREDGIVVLRGQWRAGRGGGRRLVVDALWPGGEGFDPESAKSREARTSGTPQSPPTPPRETMEIHVPGALDEETLGALAILVKDAGPGPLRIVLDFEGKGKFQLAHSFPAEARDRFDAWSSGITGAAPSPQ